MQLSIIQKQARVILFLLAAVQKPIFERLRARGFTLAVYQLGVSLVAETVRLRLREPAVGGDNLAPLVSLERTWFPVVQATLEANFPAVFRRIFANYQRPSGPALIFVMREIHGRIAALATSTVPEDQHAWALLQERGVTGDVLAEIAAKLDEALAPPAADSAPAVVADPEALAVAEARMWSFYLEWSRIARATITDRRHLRMLGFLRPKRSAADDDEAGPEPEPPLLPAVTVPALPAPQPMPD